MGALFATVAFVVLAQGGKVEANLRPARLASPGLTVVNVEAKVGAFYTEHLAQQLKVLGVEIITVREIETLLGMERQRALLGCSNDSGSCIAELANALGADGVLLGDIARLGSRYTVNLKVIGADSGRTLAVFTGTAANEDEVIDTLNRGAHKLAVDASAALGRAAPKVLEAPAKRTSLRTVAIAPLAVGVAAVGLGVALLVWSNNDYQALKTGMPGADGPVLASRGPLTGTLGVVGLAVGGAALAAAAALFIFGGEPPVSVSVGPTGASVLLRGVWP